MAKKEAVLKKLGKYEDQLAQGILPRGVSSVLSQYAEADGVGENFYRKAIASGQRALSAPSFGSMRTFAIIASSTAREGFTAFKKINSLQRQPEYEIGVFAREHLLLTDGDVQLTEEEIDENRRRIERYKTEIEAR